MSIVTIHNGAQSAQGIPPNSDAHATVRAEVRTLAELLACLNAQPTSQTPMLRSTAGKIAGFLGKSIDDISLDLIHANREGFRPFLEGQRHKEGSIRSYVNYLRMLLEAAERLGWRPFAQLPSEWGPVLEAAKHNKCLALMKSMAQAKTKPAEITQADLNRWIELAAKQSKRYTTIRTLVSAAWRTLVSCGHAQNAPIEYLRRKRYGVALSAFPEPLQAQVRELLRWKSAEYEADRPKRAKVRKVSASCIRRTFSTLFGYATNIAKFQDIASLDQLIQKPVFGGYISWVINEQKVKGTPLIPQLAAVIAAVAKHPDHKALDVSWFRALRETIPTEPYDTVKARKAKKYLPYSVLEGIPAKIHANRRAEVTHGKEHVARLAMEELMISWLLVFAWRQRNIRECRVAGPDPNLFKAVIDEFSDIDKPDWVVKEEANNPNAEFWQVKFSVEETKTGVSVHSLVPKQLILMLEEYLSQYRPLLLKGRDCDTLFVPPEADELNGSFINSIVSYWTLRYGGRRVTPHLLRDIVAFAWLKAHREDYLTLSKLLWHKNVQTTIKYYASRFNESSATVAMESWLDERELGTRQK